MSRAVVSRHCFCKRLQLTTLRRIFHRLGEVGHVHAGKIIFLNPRQGGPAGSVGFRSGSKRRVLPKVLRRVADRVDMGLTRSTLTSSVAARYETCLGQSRTVNHFFL